MFKGLNYFTKALLVLELEKGNCSQGVICKKVIVSLPVATGTSLCRRAHAARAPRAACPLRVDKKATKPTCSLSLSPSHSSPFLSDRNPKPSSKTDVAPPPSPSNRRRPGPPREGRGPPSAPRRRPLPLRQRNRPGVAAIDLAVRFFSAAGRRSSSSSPTRAGRRRCHHTDRPRQRSPGEHLRRFPSLPHLFPVLRAPLHLRPEPAVMAELEHELEKLLQLRH